MANLRLGQFSRFQIFYIFHIGFIIYRVSIHHKDMFSIFVNEFWSFKLPPFGGWRFQSTEFFLSLLIYPTIKALIKKNS